MNHPKQVSCVWDYLQVKAYQGSGSLPLVKAERRAASPGWPAHQSKDSMLLRQKNQKTG